MISNQPLKVVLYKDKSGDWRWRVQAANNKTIADSSEGYKNYQDALDGVTLLQNGLGQAIFETKDKQ